MAEVLALNTPAKVTLSADTYTRFEIDQGRNCIITVGADVYYHPVGETLDAQAVNASEQFRWIGPSMVSFRMPGSGVGKQGLPHPAPSLNGKSYFALAGRGASVEVWLLPVLENISE